MAEQSQSRMGIGAKVFMVAAVFSLPIITLAYFVWSANHDNVTVCDYELAGDAYQTPLEYLLQDVMEHQRLTHHCPGNGDCSKDIAALKDSISKELQDLNSVQQKYGALLEFTGEGLAKRNRQMATAENLAKNWNEITDMLDKSKGKPFEGMDAKYDGVVDIIHTMTTHLGDTSQLILDPTLDTYHFMVDTLLTLPQTQDRIERMVMSVREAYSHGTPFGQKDRTILAQHAALMKSMDVDQLQLDTKTALNENNNDYHPAVDSFQKKVPADMKDYVDAATVLIDMTNKLANEPRPPFTLDQYTAQAIKARQAAFKMWFEGAPEEDNLLHIRSDWYSNRATRSLLLSSLALLASILIAWAVAKSMIGPLNKLSLTLTPGATLLAGSVKQLSQKAGGSDSVKIICEELNAHADDMRKTARELETLVFGHEVHKN